MAPYFLTAAQTEALDQDGYLVIPAAVDAGWIERLRRAFAGAAAQQDGTQHVSIGAETPERDAWDALREHPAVRAVATYILEGAPFGVRDLHGRNPLPGYGQQGLHADWKPRLSVKPFFVVTALWMIDDFTPENGATRLVPGSHLIMRPIPKEFAQPAAKHAQERVITGTAGSVLVFNGHLWHAGRQNQSRQGRRAGQMVIQRRD